MKDTPKPNDDREEFIRTLVFRMRREGTLWSETVILTIDKTATTTRVGEFRSVEGFAESLIESDDMLLAQVLGLREKFPDNFAVVLWDGEGAFVMKVDRRAHKARRPQSRAAKPPPIECGKPTTNGPCFLPAAHSTPAPVDYLTPRYDASPEEIERYRQARLGCVGRPPKKERRAMNEERMELITPGSEEKPLRITQSVQFRFRCRIVEIKREGKEVTTLDAPASWEIDESFAAGDETVYRLSGLGPNGVRFTAEMTARDCDYSGYGWPAAMNEDLVIPTFERLLAEGEKG